MRRVVDLTRLVVPGKEIFRLEIQTFQVREYLPAFHQGTKDWHIIQDLQVCSHIGTHVEAPLHHLKNGKDISALPLDTLMGPAVRLDFRSKGRRGTIEEEDVRRLSNKIRKNDIILLWVGWDKYYKQPEHLERPSLSFAAAKFLVGKGIKCIGVDASGIEVAPKAAEQPNHHLLFKHNIPIIEELTNLGAVKSDRFTFIGLPLKVKHLDSSPIRAIAIEE